MQKLKDSFEKMDTYMQCYRQCIHHFKSRFPYVSAQSFNEGEINIGIINDTSDQARNRGGREGGSLPCPFSKIGKKCPDFGGKCPDCGHLWFKFII